MSAFAFVSGKTVLHARPFARRSSQQRIRTRPRRPSLAQVAKPEMHRSPPGRAKRKREQSKARNASVRPVESPVEAPKPRSPAWALASPATLSHWCWPLEAKTSQASTTAGALEVPVAAMKSISRTTLWYLRCRKACCESASTQDPLAPSSAPRQRRASKPASTRVRVHRVTCRSGRRRVSELIMAKSKVLSLSRVRAEDYSDDSGWGWSCLQKGTDGPQHPSPTRQAS